MVSSEEPWSDLGVLGHWIDTVKYPPLNERPNPQDEEISSVECYLELRLDVEEGGPVSRGIEVPGSLSRH